MAILYLPSANNRLPSIDMRDKRFLTFQFIVSSRGLVKGESPKRHKTKKIPLLRILRQTNRKFIEIRRKTKKQINMSVI